MQDFHIVIAALTGIILFVFGLDNFSKELQRIAGEKLRRFVSKVTEYPIASVGIGALITALIQSSSATSVIAIGLVNAGVLSFKNSVGIIFGSNIGTTITAQLVAFKLTSFAPLFVILGFLLALFRNRYSVFAKAIFYFGFVFFSLNLISHSLEPLQNDERVVGFLTQAHDPLLAILFGCIITALVQSSSVVTGLAVIFIQQGLLTVENAVPILMGANIGTTVTALLSMLNMDISAKKTALTHLLFNVGGVILFLPVLYLFADKVTLLADTPGVALANFHLIFNVTTSLFFVVLLTPFTRLIERLLGEGKMDFDRLDLDFSYSADNFDKVTNALLSNLQKISVFMQENYNLITLSIETNYKSIHETAVKRLEYIDYVRGESLRFFSQVFSQVKDEEEIKTVLSIVNMYEYIYQIHDSIEDIAKVKSSMSDNFIELKSDMILLVRELSSKTLTLFQAMQNGFDKADTEKLTKTAHELQTEINTLNRNLLKQMAQNNREDLAVCLHLLTYSQRLKDKLQTFHSLVQKHHSAGTKAK